jgi:hypothetical protein
MAVEAYPEQDPEVIYPERILHVAVSIGIKWLVEISWDHCSFVGNWI